jgi:hypothetical protein
MDRARWQTLASSVVTALIALALAVAPTIAYHSPYVYGDRGYAWLARYYDYAEIWVTSDMCNDRETGAYTRITNSTAGTSELDDRWPSGLRLLRYTCDGVVDDSTDIKIHYSDWDLDQHNGSNAAGENHFVKAPQEWCDLWNDPYPCGPHPSKVHVNLDWWNGAGSTSRERLLMHETGHSMGLAHHCTSDSIMNTGEPDPDGCNGGRWTEVMVYKPTDRDGIRSIFPGWLYP